VKSHSNATLNRNFLRRDVKTVRESERERETVDNCLRQSSRCQVQINENYDEQNKKMVPIEAQ